MPEHTGRQSVWKCLEFNTCLEAATADLLKANLLVSAFVSQRKEAAATCLYLEKGFYIFQFVLVFFYLCKCTELLVKVLLYIENR